MPFLSPVDSVAYTNRNRNGNISVLRRTLLQTELFSKYFVNVNVILNLEMHIPLKPTPKEDIFVDDVSIDWVTYGRWQTKLLDTGKVTRIHLPSQESVNSTTRQTPLHRVPCWSCHHSGSYMTGLGGSGRFKCTRVKRDTSTPLCLYHPLNETQTPWIGLALKSQPSNHLAYALP